MVFRFKHPYARSINSTSRTSKYGHKQKAKERGEEQLVVGQDPRHGVFGKSGRLLHSAPF